MSVPESNPTHARGKSHAIQRRFPRRTAPGANPMHQRGHSHGLRGQFPRCAAPEVNPTPESRHQGQIPRNPEAIPTAGQLQRSILPPRSRSRGESHGLRRSIPRNRHSRDNFHKSDSQSRRSEVVSVFPDRGICLFCVPGPHKRQIPRSPGANPTGSRVDSHGGPLRGSIPRPPGANPTGSRGQSHCRPTPEGNSHA